MTEPNDDERQTMPFVVLVTTHAGSSRHQRPVFVMAKDINGARIEAIRATKYIDNIGHIELDVHVIDETSLNSVLPGRKEMAWHYWSVAQRQVGYTGEIDRDAFEDEWAEYGAGRSG